jgi:hypothetical protein
MRHRPCELFDGKAPPLAAGTALRCAPVTAKEEPVMNGYGRCASRACPGYVDNSNIRQNRGHNRQTHW